MGVEVDAEGIVCVAMEGLEAGPCGDVPEAEGLVVRGGGEEAGVGGDGEVRDTLLVALEVVGGGEGGGGVSDDGGVGGGGGEEAAVGGELDGGEGAFVGS